MDLHIDPQKAKKAYGSFNAWANAIGVPLTTVLSWRDSKRGVPHWRVEKIAKKAVEDGKDIFAERSAPKKRKAAA
jgi:hypothetical protein